VASKLINEPGIGLRTHGLDDSRRGPRAPSYLTSSQARHSVMLKRDLVEQIADIGTHQARGLSPTRGTRAHFDPSLGLWASLQRIWMSVYGHQHSTRGKKTIMHGGRGSDLHAAESALNPFHLFISFSRHLCSLKLKRWTS
jgi:hypothetical protein